MGRVYGMGAGELRPPGIRFFDSCGQELRFLQRVAFDADADEGMASVTAIYTNGGRFQADYETQQAVSVTFRTWVKAVLRGQPDPTPTPQAVLYKSSNGTIQRATSGPLVDLPEELVEVPA